MENKKSDIKFFEKFCFLYMGFITLVCFNAFISNYEIYAVLYGNGIYTAINFLLNLPNLLIGLFVPRIIKKFGGNMMAYTHIAAQIVVSFIQIIIVVVIGNSLNPSYSTKVATLVCVFLTIFLSSAMYAIVQTLFFGISGFNMQMVQMYITGLATSNLFLSVYFLIVAQFTNSPVIRNTLRFSLVILSFIISIPLYRHISKLRLAPKNAADNEKQATSKIKREVYVAVWGKKWFILLLVGGVFFFTFLVYPSILNLAKSSHPKFGTWTTVLMFIFAVSDLCARILNTMDFKFLRGLINSRNILYVCLIDYAICLVPLFVFLATRGYINISPLTCDILNGIFFGILAFNFGYLGNVLAGMASEGMNAEEMNVVASYYNFSIVLSIFLGTGLCTLIVNVVPVTA